MDNVPVAPAAPGVPDDVPNHQFFASLANGIVVLNLVVARLNRRVRDQLRFINGHLNFILAIRTNVRSKCLLLVEVFGFIAASHRDVMNIVLYDHFLVINSQSLDARINGLTPYTH
uniref:G_PROTEIN_RECEP_F1_2 domain-containing protein n=1 Tax=Meloidogyne hapla TaxID=6305 RepID=A0A1I8BKU4_MELHA